MQQNWKTYNLDEICSKITDGAHASPKVVDSGSRMIASVKDMTDFGFDFTICKKISENDFQKLKSTGCVPEKGDVLFSKDGTIGKIVEFNLDIEIGLLSSIAIFKPHKHIVSSTFLALYLRDKTINKFISDNFRSGSAIPRIILRDFKKFNLTLPPLPEQRAIASILSALDDKIELNLQMNKTLEEMAMALYKHWFVDFGPFKDGEFVESELGMIPKGWEVRRLGEISVNSNKFRKPISTRERQKIQGIYPYYGATKILDYIDHHNLSGEYILLAEDGTVKTEKDTPFLQFIQGDFCVSNHAHILSGVGCYGNNFLYLALSNTNVVPYITGAVQLKINKQNLDQMRFITGPKAKMIEFENLVIPLFAKLKANDSENQILRDKRDYFLPKLISGEIRVKDIEVLQNV